MSRLRRWAGRTVGTALAAGAVVTTSLAAPAPAGAVGTQSPGLKLSCAAEVRQGHPAPCTITAPAVFVGFDQSGPLFHYVEGPVRLTTSSLSGGSFGDGCYLAADLPAGGLPANSSSCRFSYTPHGVGSASRADLITARYAGDEKFAAQTVTTKIAVGPLFSPAMSLRCAAEVRQGHPAACTITSLAQFVGVDQDGPIYAYADGPVSLMTSSPSGGSFGAGCYLSAVWISPLSPPDRTTCSFTYTPNGLGSPIRRDTITAHYPGNDDFTAQSVTTTVQVQPLFSPGLSLRCDAEVRQGHPAACTITSWAQFVGVDQDGPIYAFADGPVTLRTTSISGGSFGSGCYLSPVLPSPLSPPDRTTCSFTYTPKGVGSANRVDTLIAHYSGNEDFTAQTVTTSVGVRPLFSPGLSLRCDAEVRQGQPAACTITAFATPIGADQNGIVYAFADGPVSLMTSSPSGGSFGSGCYLTPTSVGTSFPPDITTCNFSYTPNGAGSASRADLITARYPGNHEYTAQSTTTKIGVRAKLVPQFTIVCATPVLQGATGGCSIRGTGVVPKGELGAGGSQTGTVRLSGSRGAVSRTFCPLVVQPDGSTLCTFTYTPSGSAWSTRRDVVTAKYPGNENFTSATVTTPVDVRQPVPVLALKCGSPDAPKQPVSCTVTAIATSPLPTPPVPHGYATFTVAGGTGTGGFSPTACQLVRASSLRSQCSVTYRSRAVGLTDQLTASLARSADYAAATTTTAVPTGKLDPQLSFFCDATSVTVGAALTCTASAPVEEGVPAPSGRVAFTLAPAPGSSGGFTPTGCLLAPGETDVRCATSYRPGGKGTTTRYDTLIAKYGGDARYAAVTVTIRVAVPPAALTATAARRASR